MKQYYLTKNLLKDARKLASVYLDKQVLEIMGEDNICLAMARNSFIAHSLFVGYERSLVERVAEHVFNAKYTSLN